MQLMNKSQFVLVCFEYFKNIVGWILRIGTDICKKKNYIYFQLIVLLLVNVYIMTFSTSFGVNDIPEVGFYY